MFLSLTCNSITLRIEFSSMTSYFQLRSFFQKTEEKRMFLTMQLTSKAPNCTLSKNSCLKSLRFNYSNGRVTYITLTLNT